MQLLYNANLLVDGISIHCSICGVSMKSIVYQLRLPSRRRRGRYA